MKENHSIPRYYVTVHTPTQNKDHCIVSSADSTKKLKIDREMGNSLVPVKFQVKSLAQSFLFSWSKIDRVVEK